MNVPAKGVSCVRAVVGKIQIQTRKRINHTNKERRTGAMENNTNQSSQPEAEKSINNTRKTREDREEEIKKIKINGRDRMQGKGVDKWVKIIRTQQSGTDTSRPTRVEGLPLLHFFCSLASHALIIFIFFHASRRFLVFHTHQFFIFRTAAVCKVFSSPPGSMLLECSRNAQMCYFGSYFWYHKSNSQVLNTFDSHIWNSVSVAQLSRPHVYLRDSGAQRKNVDKCLLFTMHLLNDGVRGTTVVPCPRDATQSRLYDSSMTATHG